MKSTALRLAEEYYKLNPSEVRTDRPMNWADMERIFGSWFARLKVTPDKALATTNWAGKVTKAFFSLHNVKCPPRKPQMVALALKLIAEFNY